MDRQLVYPGAIPLETDLLYTARHPMVGLGGIAAALFGSNTYANKLMVAPTVPASMSVQVGAGEIYALANLDDTAFSSLPADTTHQIVKQGINLDSTTLACPAPTTAGNSINYLIQAAISETDTTPVVLPYYNASNPSQAYSGPANSGTAQATRRSARVNVTVKPGVAAATGSQTTPAPDAGFIGLAVVTVAYGATAINASAITQILTNKVPSAGILAGLKSTGLLATSGYIRFQFSDSQQLLVQWGQYSGVTSVGPTNSIYESNGIPVTWPIAFSQIFVVVSGTATDVDGFGQQENAWVGSYTNQLGNFHVACRTQNATLVGTYLAIGLA